MNKLWSKNLIYETNNINMEKITAQEKLQHFDIYRWALDKFIWFKDVDLVIDDKAETCYFSPTEKKVAIAWKWLTEKQAAEDKDFEDLKVKFWIFHEFSHYRDMIKETEETWNKSMIKILTEIWKRVIIIKDWDKIKKIPLWSIIHTLYNCIDDIIVNTEVWNYVYSEITWDDMKSVYQKYLFADYKGDNKEEQSVVEIRDAITSKQEKKAELNLDEPVDYSKLPWYKALPYYFLRKYMVRDQEVILSEQLRTVLFDNKWKSRVWSESFKKLIEVFEKKISESKKGIRHEMLKDKLEEQLNLLKNIVRTQPLRNVELKKALLDSLPDGTTVITSWWKKIKGLDKNITWFLSLEDIIWLFTVTQGKDKDHRLVVSPDKRYEIIHKFFEPILMTYILMEQLDKDIPDKDTNPNQGNGSRQSNWEDSWDNNNQWWGSWWWELWDIAQEWREDKDWDEEWNNKNKSDWEQDSKDGKEWEKNWEENEDDKEIPWAIWDRIRDLKKVINYKQGEKAKENIKKQSQKSWKTLSEILKDHWFSSEEADAAKKSLDNVIRNFSEEIKEFTEMLKDELKKLEIEYEKEYFLSRKWNNVNYDAARKEIWKHLIDWDFEWSRMFDKKKFKEAIQEEFKKLVFYFMLDVSWSTEQFRSDEWYLNWIAIALAAALHNVEQDISDLIGDPNYTIPINFIVYANSAELIKCKYNSFDEMLAEANYKIITLSWWTSDIDWWSKSAEKLIEDFEDNETYVEDIKDDKMKAVVLQIADLDVTEYGVQEFRSKLKEKYWDKIDEVIKWIETKRLILWEKYEAEKFLSEEEIKKMEWEFKPTIIRDPETKQPIRDEFWNIRVKINEVGVKRKSEISDNVKKLFENLFIETMKKK